VLAGSDGGINPNRLEISILDCAGGWRAEEFSAGQLTIMDNSGLSNLQPTAVAFATERNNLVSVASQKIIRRSSSAIAIPRMIQILREEGHNDN
jgi:hypothetical protein